MYLSKFTVLSEDEIRAVHAASLEVLERCGVKIMSESVRKLLEENGVQVDHESLICRFPRALVERCISTVPHTFDLFDRNGQKVMTIGDGSVHCASGHNAIFCVDCTSLKRRYATVKDVEEFGIVSQWCKTIDIVGVPLNPMDVPAAGTLLHAAKALFETTTKPLFLSTESCGIVNSLIDMMQVVAGDTPVGEKPNAILQLSPSSPLFWQADAADGVVACAERRIPLNILPEPMSGVSAPYSVAGLLTEHNAELLSGIVIGQVANPGTPMMYGSSWTTYDMRGSMAQIGSPESTILRIAGCQMARFYQIPAHTTATNTDSNAHDEQHAWESVLSNMAAINAGNDIVMNSGMFAGGLTTSLEQLVMDNEVNGFIKRICRGVEVTPESIAAEVICAVGPTGNFLMEDHTLDNLHSDEFYDVTIRQTMLYDKWIEEGAPTIDVKAGELVKKILSAGNPADPGQEIKDQLEKIIAKFEANA